MKELLLLGSPEGIKVRDIGAIVRSSRGQVLFRIGINAVTGGIILVGAYCCCYCLCSRHIQDLNNAAMTIQGLKDPVSQVFHNSC